MPSIFDLIMDYAKEAQRYMDARYAVTHTPMPTFKLELSKAPDEIDICTFCRLSITCSHTIPEAILGKTHTDGRMTITDCSLIDEVSAPKPDELCWICGKPGCDIYVMASKVVYTHSVSISAYTGYIYTDGETWSNINVPMHDNCYPDEWG